MVMTSVAGHVTSSDFEGRYSTWAGCKPQELFEAPIVTGVAEDKKDIAKNIEVQARGARGLFIWTDCDREGEHIGTEIRDIARKVNRNLDVKRARFSNIERNHVVQAAKNPVTLDEKQANAVAARMELDLRIGASFTRLLTVKIKHLLPAQSQEQIKAVSYGSCQFPTLGFVVDRYFRVKNFVPETFWRIQVVHERDDIRVNFHWKRVHLFDRMAVVLMFERCIKSPTARVTDLTKKPTSKWRPLPLTTVELQKNGSRFLRMDSQRVMNIAEELYQGGFISYPRTETDIFPPDMDLKAIIDKQKDDSNWGAYATALLDPALNKYRTPRNGRNDDKAHPPIHPVNHTANFQSDEHRRVYEFVTRRFLACCSDDARGEKTDVTLLYGPSEIFTAMGLLVTARNYLEVYPYDRWESSQQLPAFEIGETFVPSEAQIKEGQTSPPGYLTEPELIALMDANGIGTDATMADHIAKIKQRMYVETRPRSGTATVITEDAPPTRGRGGARGRGRGRGGRNNGQTAAHGGSTTGVQEFIPTTLGVALIKGFDGMGFDLSLSKPHLRKETELQMKAICAGTTTKNDVVQESLDKYREVFIKSVGQIGVLTASVRRYVLGEDV